MVLSFEKGSKLVLLRVTKSPASHLCDRSQQYFTMLVGGEERTLERYSGFD